MPPHHMHNFFSYFSVQTRISFLKSFFIVSMINSVIKNPSKISLYFPVKNHMTWTNVPKKSWKANLHESKWIFLSIPTFTYFSVQARISFLKSFFIVGDIFLCQDFLEQQQDEDDWDDVTLILSPFWQQNLEGI